MANQDSFTEVTNVSYGDRVGNSLVGTLFGLLFFVGSFILLFWNEGRAVNTARTLEEGAALVLSIPADKIDPANNGKLVHTTGQARTADTLTDPTFGLAVNAVRLTRKVEMFQWSQDTDSNTQGSRRETRVDYKQEWLEHRVDSSQFRHPQGHVNPPMPLESRSSIAKAVTLGAFRLTDGLIGQMNIDVPLPADAQAIRKLPPALKAHATFLEGMVYIAANAPAQPAAALTPRVGDLRISFTMVLPKVPVSVIAAQQGKGFAPFQAHTGKKLELLTFGSHTAADMFRQQMDSNRTMAWILRTAGFVAMFIGLLLISAPLAAICDFIPFLGGLVALLTGIAAFFAAAALSLITISVGWFSYRPLAGFSVLAAALVALVLAATLRRRKPARHRR